MKKLLFTIALTLICSQSITVQAKSKTYYLYGTIRNYTSFTQYQDGTGYYSEGVEITDENGDIWIMEDITNLKDGQNVKIKIDTKGTKTTYDDEIISIKKVKNKN